MQQPPGGYGPPPSQQYGQPPQQQYGAPGYGPPGYPPQGYAPQEKNSSATISMWLGLGSILCWLTGVPAMIVGMMAKNQIKAQPNRYTNSGNATIGIVFGAIGTVLLIGWGLSVILLGSDSDATSTASASTGGSTKAGGSTKTAANEAKPAAETPAPAATPHEEKPTYISESCYQLSTKFGTSSKLSDLQKEEAWKSYKGKLFKWNLEITEVSSGFLGGFTVQAKCSPRSPSLVQDIQIDYDDDAKPMVMKLEKGSTYTLTGKLTNTSTLFGLGADGMP